MSRATVKARLKTLLEGLAGYDDMNVKLQADPAILLKGRQKGIAIMNGGIDFSPDWLASGATDAPIGWVTLIRVLVKYTNEVDTYNTLDTEVQNVINHLIAYPTLNGLPVEHVKWLDAQPPIEIFQEIGRGSSDGPQWLAQDLPLLTIEYTFISHKE